MTIIAQNTEAFQTELPISKVAGNVASFFNERRYVRVNTPQSDWTSAVEKTLDELTALPIGWDGYDGRPIQFTNAYFAARLLEELYNPRVCPPDLVPGSDGSLQIEWHKNNYDIEIDVLAPYEVIAYRYNCESGQSEEQALQSDFSLLAQWIRDLEENKALSSQ